MTVQPIQLEYSDYYEVQRVSNSSLAYLDKSPLHFQCHMDGLLDKEESPALSFGRMLHMSILEPDAFENAFFVKKDGRYKQFKEWNEEQEALGKTPLSQADYDHIENMTARLGCDKWLAEHLRMAEKEKDLFFDYRGVECKSKVDAIIPNKMIIDLKTTRDADPRKFIRSATWDYHYDRQAAFYSLAAKACGLMDKEPEFYFVAIEKQAPYAYSIIEVAPSIMEQGKAKYERLIDRYLDTIAKGIYPGYERERWGDDLPEGAGSFEAKPVSMQALDMASVMAAFGIQQPVKPYKPRYRVFLKDLSYKQIS